VHSDWTDGTATIEATAEGARTLGYAYIALTDHGRRITMAHGLDPARLSRHTKEIDRLNGGLGGVTILKGIEVDILEDGSLDLTDASLAELDVVIASVHSHFDLPPQAQTDRVIHAMRNRHVPRPSDGTVDW
jgi:DNA polymerase (family X)